MTRRFILFFLLIAACFVAPRLPWVVAWDRAAMFSVASLRDESGIRFFKLVTEVGSTPGFLIAWLLPGAILLLRRRFVTALYFVLGVGLLKLSGPLLKLAIARPRPPDGLEHVSSLSMPSGHAANAVLIFGILLCLLWRRFPGFFSRLLSGLLCLSAIAMIDFSRVYLGVHYPSDVLLGSLYTAAGLWLLQGLRRDVFDMA